MKYYTGAMAGFLLLTFSLKNTLHLISASNSIISFVQVALTKFSIILIYSSILVTCNMSLKLDNFLQNISFTYLL